MILIVQAGSEPFLSANTLEPSFALKAEYNSESEAVNAFNALTSVGTVSYIDMAVPLKANQVWVSEPGIIGMPRSGPLTLRFDHIRS